jgi:hypothetical protein
MSEIIISVFPSTLGSDFTVTLSTTRVLRFYHPVKLKEFGKEVTGGFNGKKVDFLTRLYYPIIHNATILGLDEIS